MTVHDKKNLIVEYCENRACVNCKLKGDFWEVAHSGDDPCLDIPNATENDLDLALELIQCNDTDSEVLDILSSDNAITVAYKLITAKVFTPDELKEIAQYLFIYSKNGGN